MEIKELRKRLKLSQEEFAHQLGISVSAIQKWEQGHRRPSKLANRQLEGLIRKAGIAFPEKGE